MHKALTILTLALLAVETVSRAQYQTFVQKADSLFFRGEYAKSSAMFGKAFQTGVNIDGKDLYNAACAAALAGNTDVAFSRLWARMEKEPNWYSKNFKDDEDLTSLHGDARWQAFADSMTVRQKRYSEGLRYLGIAKELMKPDPTIMKAITLSEGEGYYLSQQYEEAVTAWKEHLTWNPTSIATYFNLANAYAYLLKDSEQAKAYYQQFLELARKEENPNAQLLEMMQKAEEMLRYNETVKNRKSK